jgi:hypothetical protein
MLLNMFYLVFILYIYKRVFFVVPRIPLCQRMLGEESVAGVLDELYSQLTPLSGVAAQARQSTSAGTVSILCSLAGRYGYSAERA